MMTRWSTDLSLLQDMFACRRDPSIVSSNLTDPTFSKHFSQHFTYDSACGIQKSTLAQTILYADKKHDRNLCIPGQYSLIIGTNLTDHDLLRIKRSFFAYKIFQTKKRTGLHSITSHELALNICWKETYCKDNL